MTLKKYQTYIYWNFLRSFLLISCVFFCLVIIVNIFEEIRFFEKYDALVDHNDRLNDLDLLIDTYFLELIKEK